MEKTSPKASFSLKGTTADHRMDEKRSDNNQKNALKSKYILGSWGKIHEGLVDPEIDYLSNVRTLCAGVILG